MFTPQRTFGFAFFTFFLPFFFACESSTSSFGGGSNPAPKAFIISAIAHHTSFFCPKTNFAGNLVKHSPAGRPVFALDRPITYLQRAFTVVADKAVTPQPRRAR